MPDQPTGRRIAHLGPQAPHTMPRQHWRRLEQRCLMRPPRRLNRGQIAAVGQVPAARIGTGPKQAWPLGDGVAGHILHRLQHGQRTSRDTFRRHILIDDLVDETGIGAVFQQPPHEVSQQIAVRPHGRINPAPRALFGQNDVMQPLAHAMQALKFETARVPPIGAGHVQNCRDSMGVMGGKLRINPVGHRQQLARIGKVTDVCRLFAGEHRE